MRAPAGMRRGAAAACLGFALAAAMAPASAAAEDGYGAHLASYFGMSDAQKGWRILQRLLPAQLKGREPLYREAVVKGRKYVRLLAGPFAAPAAAQSFCNDVRGAWSYCDVLSLSDLRPVKAAAPAAPARPPAPAARARPPAKAEAPPPKPPVRPAVAKQEQPPAGPRSVMPAAADKAADGAAAGAGAGQGMPADAGGATGRLQFDSARLPPPPVTKVRLSPQQRAIYRPLEGNWIQFDGDCRGDLLQIGEGAARRIVGGTAQPPDQCEARREGATVALFCEGGKELWFEVLTEEELVFRRSRAHGGAPYENIDQLLSRCGQG